MHDSCRTRTGNQPQDLMAWGVMKTTEKVEKLVKVGGRSKRANGELEEKEETRGEEGPRESKRGELPQKPYNNTSLKDNAAVHKTLGNLEKEPSTRNINGEQKTVRKGVREVPTEIVQEGDQELQTWTTISLAENRCRRYYPNVHLSAL